MIDLKKIKSNTGDDIYGLSMKSPVLLIFLRHFGCVFCQEALNDISERKSDIVKNNIQLVFVHMTDNEIAEKFFHDLGISKYQHISDPSKIYYQKFGLSSGNFSQLFGLKTWVRGYSVTRSPDVNFTTQSIGDSFQMPGIFLIENGSIVDSYIHKSASDKPDYDKFINRSQG